MVPIHGEGKTMSHSAAANAAKPLPRSSRSLANLSAFLFGVPAGLAVLFVLLYGPLKDSEANRYVHHPVERVEVILFFCALGALLGKALGQWTERAALRRSVLPAWDGHPVSADDAGRLLGELRFLSRRVQNTYLARRVVAVLDFVRSRGSANELDDQLRALADNDAMALEGSYSLIRLITWAIPILGFLGTVLGITGAISGVTPEVLEKSIGGVTSGLSLAFDATALGLGLTMIVMFVNYLVERLEQKTLQAVDQYADEHLAHRFERSGPDGLGLTGALRMHTQHLLQATEGLVERQAQVWARSIESAEVRWAETTRQQQEQIQAALEAALDHTLATYNQRLNDLEGQAVERTKALYDGLTALTTVLRDTNREHQAALAQIVQKLGGQAETLARIQEGEAQVVRLQETMQHNLAALANSGAFEQAVASLTAAIHLLTAKTSVPPRPAARSNEAA
jgi:biopolymer transport protein ExbB/TolQ/uncharacterized protein YaeQ